MPDPIDNEPLVEPQTIDQRTGLPKPRDLKLGLLEGEHYVLVSEKAWRALKSWYVFFSVL